MKLLYPIIHLLVLIVGVLIFLDGLNELKIIKLKKRLMFYYSAIKFNFSKRTTGWIMLIIGAYFMCNSLVRIFSCLG